MSPPSNGRHAPKQKQRRGGEAKKIADLIPAIGRASFRRFGFVQSAVISRWPEIVGTKLAQLSTPEAIHFNQGSRREGTLQIRISGAHAPMVQHLGQDLIERVNRFFGYKAVARLRFRHGNSGEWATRAAASTNENGYSDKTSPHHNGEQNGDIDNSGKVKRDRHWALDNIDGLRDIRDPELVEILTELAIRVDHKTKVDSHRTRPLKIMKMSTKADKRKGMAEKDGT